MDGLLGNPYGEGTMQQTESVEGTRLRPLPARRMPANPHLEVLLVRVERAVRRRTGDRVRGLQVLLQNDKLVLRGRCATYYCKQLAQAAAMEAAPDFELHNQIKVW